VSSLTSASDRIDQLAQDLRQYKRLYYAGEPEISDAEYDAPEDEFRALVAEHPELTPADNPLEEVGAELAGELYADARHEMPVLSLEKATTDAELEGFLSRFPGQTFSPTRLSPASNSSRRCGPAGEPARCRPPG